MTKLGWEWGDGGMVKDPCTVRGGYGELFWGFGTRTSNGQDDLVGVGVGVGVRVKDPDTVRDGYVDWLWREPGRDRMTQLGVGVRVGKGGGGTRP